MSFNYLIGSWSTVENVWFAIGKLSIDTNTANIQVSQGGEKYPVFLFFHGGGFQYGASNDWPAEVLASKGLVVITANYRLGPFGEIFFVNSCIQGLVTYVLVYKQCCA